MKTRQALFPIIGGPAHNTTQIPLNSAGYPDGYIFRYSNHDPLYKRIGPHWVATELKDNTPAVELAYLSLDNPDYHLNHDSNPPDDQ